MSLINLPHHISEYSITIARSPVPISCFLLPHPHSFPEQQLIQFLSLYGFSLLEISFLYLNILLYLLYFIIMIFLHFVLGITNISNLNTFFL